jgi:hypothetical protein
MSSALVFALSAIVRSSFTRTTKTSKFFLSRTTSPNCPPPPWRTSPNQIPTGKLHQSATLHHAGREQLVQRLHNSTCHHAITKCNLPSSRPQSTICQPERQNLLARVAPPATHKTSTSSVQSHPAHHDWGAITSPSRETVADFLASYNFNRFWTNCEIDRFISLNLNLLALVSQGKGRQQKSKNLYSPAPSLPCSRSFSPC